MNNNLLDSNCTKILDWSLALKRTGGKETLAIAMLQGLITFLPESMINIKDALQSQDSHQLKHLIHKLNGTCCYTGVPNLTKICQEIETQLKNEITLSYLTPEFFELFEQIDLVLLNAPSLLAKITNKNN